MATSSAVVLFWAVASVLIPAAGSTTSNDNVAGASAIRLSFKNTTKPSNASHTTTNHSNKHAHIYFLLDRSGSMSTIVDDVIGGFNAFVGEQKTENYRMLMTLVQFDSQNLHDVVFSALNINEVPQLTKQTFVPRSMTPLFDALGKVIAMAGKAWNPEGERVVVVVFSDGQENASREYTRKTLFNFIEAKRKEGWTFVFLGANQDSYAEGSGLGIPALSTQNFAFDSKGTWTAFSSLSKAASNLNYKLSSAQEEFYDNDDFFEGTKSAEDDYARRVEPIVAQRAPPFGTQPIGGLLSSDGATNKYAFDEL